MRKNQNRRRRKVLAEIGKRDGGVELALFDAAGHARISIGVRKNGTPQTSLLDETEHVRLESVIEPEGAAQHAIMTRITRPAY